MVMKFEKLLNHHLPNLLLIMIRRKVCSPPRDFKASKLTLEEGSASFTEFYSVFRSSLPIYAHFFLSKMRSGTSRAASPKTRLKISGLLPKWDTNAELTLNVMGRSWPMLSLWNSGLKLLCLVVEWIVSPLAEYLRR